MAKSIIFAMVVLLGFASALALPAAGDENSITKSFQNELAKKAEAAFAAEKMTVQGKDGWLFLAAELRALSTGPFWGETAIQACRAAKPENRDPLPVIVDFNTQLKNLGIELLLVPVPGKCVIYPEKVSDEIKPDASGNIPRLDINHEEFYSLLRKNGVAVLDLVPHFLPKRSDKEGLLCCRQDSHWSGRACQITARLIAEQIKRKPWFQVPEKKTFAAETRAVEIRGNLREDAGLADTPPEKMPLRFISEKGNPVETDKDSQIILLGDSHTLVFHVGGSLLARGAGLADQLAYELGIPVDLLGVRGSGAITSRVNLYLRIRSAQKKGENYIERKKLIVWCLSMREFTESFTGWKKVPVVKK